MRLLIQRVKNASVSVGGDELSRIGQGLLVLVGVGVEDTDEDMEYLAGKLVRLRIFDDGQGVMKVKMMRCLWNSSVNNGGLSVISGMLMFHVMPKYIIWEKKRRHEFCDIRCLRMQPGRTETSGSHWRIIWKTMRRPCCFS